MKYETTPPIRNKINQLLCKANDVIVHKYDSVEHEELTNLTMYIVTQLYTLPDGPRIVDNCLNGQTTEDDWNAFKTLVEEIANITRLN